MESLGVDGKTILRMHLREMDVITRKWVDSAQVRDYWKALVNAALNLRVS